VNSGRISLNLLDTVCQISYFSSTKKIPAFAGISLLL
jgi:hypothetical protein